MSRRGDPSPSSSARQTRKRQIHKTGTLVCVSDDAPGAQEPPKAPEQALELGSPAAWDGLALTATPRDPRAALGAPVD